MRTLAAFLRSIEATVRTGFATAARVKRSALLNGVAGGLSFAFAAIVAGFVFPAHTPAILLGAICLSVADLTASLREKLLRMGLAWILSALTMLAAAAAIGQAWAEAAAVVGVGFGAAMVTAYGRNAIPVSVAILMALVFAGSVATGATPAAAAAWFSLGGLCYGFFATLATVLLTTQTKRMFVRETLDDLSAYLRAQSAALQEGEPREVYAELVDAQAEVAERLQAARDVVFIDIETASDRTLLAALVVAIDIFEAAFSDQAELDTLLDMRGEREEPLRVLRALLALAASDIDRFSRALVDPRNAGPSPRAQRRALLDALADSAAQAEAARRHALRATAEKIGVLFDHIDRIFDVLVDPQRTLAAIDGIDLGRFVQKSVYGLRPLLRNLDARSPVARFALRLSLALLCGWILGEALPYRAHGIWILLTIALVMRANYSITRRRRDERVLGNVFGAALAAAMLAVAPGWLIPFILLVAVGCSRAFVVQSYFVSSIASCVTAMMLVHATEPENQLFFLLMRVVDTALGAAIAFAFSYLFPVWERRTIEALIPDLLRAARDYARQALSPDADDETYRLARRRMFDAIAALAAAARRMLDEPGPARIEPRALAGVLAAGYGFAAELASVQLRLRASAETIDADLARALARACAQIEAELERPGAAVVTDEPDPEASPLARGLAHSVSAAGELSASAAQAGARLAEPRSASAVTG